IFSGRGTAVEGEVARAHGNARELPARHAVFRAQEVAVLPRVAQDEIGSTKRRLVARADARCRDAPGASAPKTPPLRVPPRQKRIEDDGQARESREGASQ